MFYVALLLRSKFIQHKIQDLGTPDDNLWPGYSSLPGPRKTTFDHHDVGELEKKFPTSLIDERGLEFIKEFV